MSVNHAPRELLQRGRIGCELAALAQIWPPAEAELVEKGLVVSGELRPPWVPLWPRPYDIRFVLNVAE